MIASVSSFINKEERYCIYIMREVTIERMSRRILEIEPGHKVVEYVVKAAECPNSVEVCIRTILENQYYGNHRFVNTCVTFQEVSNRNVIALIAHYASERQEIIFRIKTVNIIDPDTELNEFMSKIEIGTLNIRISGALRSSNPLKKLNFSFRASFRKLFQFVVYDTHHYMIEYSYNSSDKTVTVQSEASKVRKPKDTVQATMLELRGEQISWKLNEELHRENGPALITQEGKFWFIEGKAHRFDGPAKEYSSGRKDWFYQGERHRENGPAIETEDGGKSWLIKGQYHRIDGPAVENSDGTRIWYVYDKLHRIDGPAIIKPGEYKMWYILGKRHREDGPALEYSNGTKAWYFDDILIMKEFKGGLKKWYYDDYVHNDNGPAEVYTDGTKIWRYLGNLHNASGPAVELPNGSKFWYNYGRRHRDDGPAIELSNGTVKYYQNGILHRVDGPAVQKPDGTKIYYFKGQRVTKSSLEKKQKRAIARSAMILASNKVFDLELVNHITEFVL